MRWVNKVTIVVAVGLVFGVGAATSYAQKKGPSQAEVDKLRAEVDRLRADLDAAIREINALKAAAGGKVVPEKGPLYRGRSASYWLEQLKDLEPRTRVDAVEAIGALAQKDKKLIPALVDAAKTDIEVSSQAIKALGAAGPEALPTLIEMLKDKRLRLEAVKAIGGMGPKAKSAVPALANSLEEQAEAYPLLVTIIAIQRIGPDAKEAIPSLVKALGACLEDIGKPENESPQPRFGVRQDSINVLIVDTLKRLDQALATDVALPKVNQFGGRPSTPAQQTEWRALHATLVKRYLKPK